MHVVCKTMAQSTLRPTHPRVQQTLSQDIDPSEEIRIVMIGKTGNGKSASANTILGREAFRSVMSANSITAECDKARGTVDGRRVAVIDTPGIYDTKYKEHEVIFKLKECVSLSAPGPHVFLIVVKVGRFTEEEQKTVELLQQVFGSNVDDYSLVLFTHGDLLRSKRIEEYFRECEKLTHLISKCKQRYHVFNNNATDRSQVTQLFTKISSSIRENSGNFYTNAMYQEAERAIQEEADKILRASAEQQRRQKEELRAQLQGEELQKRLERLDNEYRAESRKKAEKKNSFLNSGLIVATAEVGVAIGAGVGAIGGPLCIGLGAAMGGVVGAVVGVLGPAAVKALKNKCTVQ